MSGHDVKTANIVVLKDGEAIAQHMAHWLLEQALEKKDGPFVVALSGGSTPKHLFQLLAEPAIAERFPWDRTQIFYGDERYVPIDDPSNNYAMSREALLSHVPVPAANVHRMPTEGEPSSDAARYQKELQEVYGQDTLQPGKPLFDVVMLGMGPDGHTASLFPRQPVLQEKKLWVSTCTPDNAPHTRLTLTYPAIHSSRHVVFMLAGDGKAEMLARVRRGDDASLPSSHITTEGDLTFLVDEAAAKDLPSC
ncbi:6-phosphogluconolactonase [Neoasaia chiangmaiensis NBRC 101099]|uniref:6-phosphogluconolactonase n=1 Tax=Neoasaia chiangmaiensis TaxID=320497 RepID=A0A1U9KNT7_9PROT|nr:6-phosphogluconolactonase [Neoasaia chiangmaiensis]AQS87370.1 6-phosphogluconolactonase [Neoasaia chiangmaiensis]GBR42952.1 6-phosphogluconolactonase [Neoasaia chiangmaiensis NBRC 101099]GEN16134.1 6-phosphogluconolactonase [Neoasaia chiangmaiensis]